MIFHLFISLFFAVQGFDESARRAEYFSALQDIDFNEVKADILELLTDSQDFFPADYGHYGPFMVRMAWHCAGTYRQSDGEGGCDGGRQRFDPERSWVDNTNLDKARKLLEPIKLKYGVGLSWGDLIIYTGNVALESMGTPLIGFCAGRVDDLSGANSVILGPSDLQEQVTPCEDNGNCSAPFGAILLDHIYVDASGFKGNPDPALSVDPIRNVFARMGMNDVETVALIGGGHTFGKTHGACPGGAGKVPFEDPENPWPFPNQCGATQSSYVTSGFEGPWTTRPVEWTPNYFLALTQIEWNLTQSGAGNNQFQPLDQEILAPSPDADLESVLNGEDRTQSVMMLVTDIALLHDDKYRSTVQSFADDFDEQGRQFALAWYKLTTRDMGPSTRCFGNMVPESQLFQADVPAPNPDFNQPLDAFQLNSGFIRNVEVANSDVVNGNVDNRYLLIEAAFLCASTFRVTDYFGGCNGGRIAAQPEREWPDRVPVDALVQEVDRVSGNSKVSFSDQLVFFATEALQDLLDDEFSRNFEFVFCPLRSDVNIFDFQDVSETIKLQEYDNKIIEQKRHARLMNMSNLEYVAIQGRPRSVEYMKSLGYSGSYSNLPTSLTNSYAKTLLENSWTRNGVTGIFGDEFVNADGSAFITFRDFVLTLDDDFSAALFEFAANEEFFIATFISTWTNLMNADRFDGPVENFCTNGKVELFNLGNIDSATDDGDSTPVSVVGLVLAMFGAAVISASLITVYFVNYKLRHNRRNSHFSVEEEEEGHITKATL